MADVRGLSDAVHNGEKVLACPGAERSKFRCVVASCVASCLLEVNPPRRQFGKASSSRFFVLDPAVHLGIVASCFCSCTFKKDVLDRLCALTVRSTSFGRAHRDVTLPSFPDVPRAELCLKHILTMLFRRAPRKLLCHKQYTHMAAQALLDCTRATWRPRHQTGVTLRSDERSQIEDAPPRGRQNAGTTPCSKTHTTAPFALALPRNMNELCTDCDVCLSQAFDVQCVHMWRALCLSLIFAACEIHSFCLFSDERFCFVACVLHGMQFTRRLLHTSVCPRVLNSPWSRYLLLASSPTEVLDGRVAFGVICATQRLHQGFHCKVVGFVDYVWQAAFALHFGKRTTHFARANAEAAQ